MWPATERFGLRIAPSGLALVQDLLNTDAPVGRTDLLADAGEANRWARAALGAATPPLTDTDAEHLRAFRTGLRATIRGHSSPEAPVGPETPVGPGTPDTPETSGGHPADPGGAAVPVEAALDAEGDVVLRPTGDGWRYVVSAVLIAAHDARLTGEWHRLKVCRNDACGTAFHDRSRNSSAVWHSAVVCGNAPNLRASRARRRPAPDAG